jgi:hypothetical protein
MQYGHRVSVPLLRTFVPAARRRAPMSAANSVPA